MEKTSITNFSIVLNLIKTYSACVKTEMKKILIIADAIAISISKKDFTIADVKILLEPLNISLNHVI